MSHGFDDQGSQFDKTVTLNNWWTAAKKEKFESRTKILVDHFNKIELAGKKERCQMTLGENIGDNGGLNIAFRALQNVMKTEKLGVKDGSTPEQRFFLAWARVWAGNARPEYLQYLMTVHVHSPNEARVNGALPMAEFHRIRHSTSRRATSSLFLRRSVTDRVKTSGQGIPTRPEKAEAPVAQGHRPGYKVYIESRPESAKAFNMTSFCPFRATLLLLVSHTRVLPWARQLRPFRACWHRIFTGSKERKSIQSKTEEIHELRLEVLLRGRWLRRRGS